MRSVRAQLWGCAAAIIFAAQSTATPARADETGPLGWGKPGFQEELISDRPDFTESTETIDSGHLQLEGGYTFTDAGDGENHTFPEALLRVGLTPSSELRLGWDGFVIDEPDDVSGSRVEGATDTSVGAKLRLCRGTEQLPATSIILELGLPTGHTDVSSNGIEPAVVLLLAADLAFELSLSSNLTLAARSDGDGNYFEAVPTVALSAPLTGTVGAYIEFFGFYPEERADADDESYVDGGLTFGITEDLQLDARIGAGLNSAADDLFTGVGFAVRL